MVTKRTKSRPANRPMAAEPEDADLGGLAIVASAIGHIAQASRSSDLQKEKESLLDVLRGWQRAYHRAVAQVGDLRRAFDSLRRAYDTLVSQEAQLEQENALWRSKYHEALLELEKARISRTESSEHP